jgi:hypothetical protein
VPSANQLMEFCKSAGALPVAASASLSQASHNGYVCLAQLILAPTFHQRGNISHGVLTRCAPRQQRQPNGCGLSHITNPLRMPVIICKALFI